MTTGAIGPARDLPVIGTDPDGFEGFYREHIQLVRLYLARRVDDPFTAADLTADVFVRAIHAAHTYRYDLGPPRAWLIGIARNIVAEHRRASARENAAVRRLSGRRLLDDNSAERIVERIPAQAEARALLASIADLPEALRNIVELVAVDGLSVTEAAGVLGIRPGAARVRYHRARQVLRRTSTLHADEVTS